MTMRGRRRGDSGALAFVVAVVVAVLGLLVAALIIWVMTIRLMKATPQTVTRTASDAAPFVEAWSVAVSPQVVLEFATVPGRPGEFFALNDDQIYRFDATGAVRSKFAALPKSSRISTDRAGTLPYLLIVSRKTKWTGAIDYTTTTDYFLNALDTRGQTVWTRRFDPKNSSTLETVVTMMGEEPVVVLSAGKHITCLDRSGRTLWDLALWHHSGSVAPFDLNGDGSGNLIVAEAPKRPIVRVDSRGRIAGVWAAGDGPSRLRTINSPSTGLSAISLRQVFGRGPGVRHALTFFDAAGTTLGETELPPDVSLLSYSPIASMDVSGSGDQVWVVALGDGSIRLFSSAGKLLARYDMRVRPRTYLAVPQKAGPDLLVVATNSGVTALRPVAARIREP